MSDLRDSDSDYCTPIGGLHSSDSFGSCASSDSRRRRSNQINTKCPTRREATGTTPRGRSVCPNASVAARTAWRMVCLPRNGWRHGQRRHDSGGMVDPGPFRGRRVTYDKCSRKCEMNYAPEIHNHSLAHHQRPSCTASERLVMLQPYERHTPNIDATAFVHEGAWVIGKVEVGPQSSVWPTAVLRGDVGPIRIGARSNIQDGAICHDTTSISAVWVGDEVTVGHRAILHGCRIEDRCLIGMGAIVLDNAWVGEGSVIGAGAVVVAGTIIPPNSVVFGTPGKVVRSTTDVHKRMIEAGWAAYVEETRRWLAQ